MEISKVHIARLVLGYLKSEGCKKAFNEFLIKSHYLKSHAVFVKNGKYFATRVAGLTLEDILADYSDVSLIIEGRLEQTDYYDKGHMMKLSDQLMYILNHNSRSSSPALAKDLNATLSESLPGNSSKISHSPNVKLDNATGFQSSSNVTTITQLKEGKKTMMADLDKQMKTIEEKREQDPVFDQILEEIIVAQPQLSTAMTQSQIIITTQPHMMVAAQTSKTTTSSSNFPNATLQQDNSSQSHSVRRVKTIAPKTDRITIATSDGDYFKVFDKEQHIQSSPIEVEAETSNRSPKHHASLKGGLLKVTSRNKTPPSQKEPPGESGSSIVDSAPKKELRKSAKNLFKNNRIKKEAWYVDLRDLLISTSQPEKADSSLDTSDEKIESSDDRLDQTNDKMDITCDDEELKKEALMIKAAFKTPVKSQVEPKEEEAMKKEEKKEATKSPQEIVEVQHLKDEVIETVETELYLRNCNGPPRFKKKCNQTNMVTETLEVEIVEEHSPTAEASNANTKAKGNTKNGKKNLSMMKQENPPCLDDSSNSSNSSSSSTSKSSTDTESDSDFDYSKSKKTITSPKKLYSFRKRKSPVPQTPNEFEVKKIVPSPKTTKKTVSVQEELKEKRNRTIKAIKKGSPPVPKNNPPRQKDGKFTRYKAKNVALLKSGAPPERRKSVKPENRPAPPKDKKEQKETFAKTDTEPKTIENDAGNKVKCEETKEKDQRSRRCPQKKSESKSQNKPASKDDKTGPKTDIEDGNKNDEAVEIVAFEADTVENTVIETKRGNEDESRVSGLGTGDDDLMNFAVLGNMMDEQKESSQRVRDKRKISTEDDNLPPEKKCKTENEKNQALLKRINVDLFLNKLHGKAKPS